jgi:hypothetical protein
MRKDLSQTAIREGTRTDSFGTDFKSLGVENGEGDLIHVGPVISAIQACFALDTNDEFRSWHAPQE